MKSKISSIIILFLISCSFIANAAKPRAKGYYINKEGEKIVGMIEVQTELLSKEMSNLQYDHATFFDKRGKEFTITRENAIEFGFNYQNEDAVFRLLGENVEKALHLRANFYKLILDGPCAIYLGYIPDNGGRMAQYVLYKDDFRFYVTTDGAPVLKMSTSPGRIKDINLLFQDCPDLVAKIEAKEYKKGDDRYIRMVQFYNSNCGSTSTEKKEESEN